MRVLASLSELKAHSGTYVLWIQLHQARQITVASLGSATFLPGIYSYTGRDRSRLQIRLKRHLRQQKKHHWHVDYLLTENASIFQIWIYANHPEWECRVNQLLEKLPTATIPLSGFGSSDCKAGCQAHLIQHLAVPKPEDFFLRPDWIIPLENHMKKI